MYVSVSRELVSYVSDARDYTMDEIVPNFKCRLGQFIPFSKKNSHKVVRIDNLTNIFKLNVVKKTQVLNVS